MIEEIKMCKKSEGDEYNIIDGVDLNDYYWVPLDPQPSCENCKHNTDENDYGNLILCDTLVIGGLWRKKEFYCSYWKAKEVKKHKQLPEYSYGDYIGQEGH